MLLQKLEMQGFKSFPDKTVLEFGKGITAVVGPNGSGKSNISDAIRWVLGETSTKSLRGTKMEDVIFSGTSSRKALGFAQVKLTLDNSDKTLADYNDVVTVSRKYYRSGESEYFIDNKNVRRRDIHELFMDTGLGTDGYSIVGQGQIDSIISAKTEERRELFEEAAGISHFRFKRNEAERRLDAAEENIVRLSDILSELEMRVGPLKEQSEKAQKFIDYSNEKKNLEIGLWLNKINKFTNDLREYDHKIDAAKASYDQCEEQLNTIENDINNENAEISNINVQIEETRTSGARYEEEALKSENEISVIQSNIRHSDETSERLKNDIDLLNNDNDAIEKQISEKKELINSSNKTFEEKNTLISEYAKKIEELISKENEYSDSVTDLSKKISEYTIELSTYKMNCSRALSGAEEVKKRAETIDENISDISQKMDEAQKSLMTNKENIAAANSDMQEYSNICEGFQMKLKTNEQEIAALKTEYEKVSREESEKESKSRMLSELERNMDGYSGAVKAVVKAANSSILHGICSPLSMVIKVDKEYSMAIETALGTSLQNIITENENDAKNAMYYLKRNNLGRATFLPISRIKGRSLNENGLDTHDGYVSVASDLIVCDDKFRNIVDNLLAKVVVAEDIDSALSIAKSYSNRFKIVTLDGQVINAGGSMTGGSAAKGIGMLSRKNMIEELSAEVAKLKNKVNDFSDKLRSLENEKKNIEDSINKNNELIQSEREKIIRLKGEGNLITEKIESFSLRIDELNSEKNNGDERLNLYLEEQKKNEQLAEITNNKINSAEIELEKATNHSQKFSSEREDVRQKFDNTNLELTVLIHDIDAAKNSLNDLIARRDLNSEKVMSIEKEINNIEDQKKENEDRIVEIEKKSKELHSMATGSNSKIDQLISERNEHEKRTNDLRILERDKIQEREHVSGEIVRLDDHKNSIRKEYDDINNMLFEQYEMTRREAEGLNIVIKDLPAARKKLNKIKNDIKALGTINVGAIEEYKEVSERYGFLKDQLDDILKSKTELKNIISKLTISMSERFLTQFNKINNAFKTCFADFFGGGKGEILLEDENNCLECGIEIKIQPPGKSVQNINLFSGGEKSLAAMALLFSVLNVTPSPFCVYDEVEAALDELNVERFAKYMRKMTEKTQFISITHRRGTMEEADVLYGITMQEKGVSKLLKLESAQLAEEMGLSD